MSVFKNCVECLQDKELNKANFYERSESPDGFRNKCKQCMRNPIVKLYHCSICNTDKKRNEFRFNSLTGVKTECLKCEEIQLRCSKCNIVKKHEEFPECKQSSTGRHSWCLDCHCIRSCEYVKDHTLERRKRSRTPQIKAKRQAYKQRPDIKIKNRLYQRTYSRKRYRDPVNHAKHLARSEVKKALKRGTIIKATICQGERLRNPLCLPNSLLEAHHTLGYAQEHWLDVEWLCKSCHTIVDMVERDDGKVKSEAPVVDFAVIIALYLNPCAYCGCGFTTECPATEDHVIPIVHGGLHTPDNVVPACLGCNSKKHDGFIAYKPLPGYPVSVEELIRKVI